MARKSSRIERERVAESIPAMAKKYRVAFRIPSLTIDETRTVRGNIGYVTNLKGIVAGLAGTIVESGGTGTLVFSGWGDYEGNKLPAEIRDRLAFEMKSELPRILTDRARPSGEFRFDHGMLKIEFEASIEPVDRNVNLIEKEVSEPTTISGIMPEASFPDPSGTASNAERIAALDQLFQELPDRYELYSSQLEQIVHAFRAKLAERLAPELNAKLREMPHATYEEKKEMAKWVNDELRRFGLAIKCPKTGSPSIMLVDGSYYRGTGRFLIEHRNDEGKRIRSFSSTELPELVLTESSPRREAFIEWREKVQRSSNSENDRDR